MPSNRMQLAELLNCCAFQAVSGQLLTETPSYRREGPGHAVIQEA